MANDLVEPAAPEGPKSPTADTDEKEFSEQDVDAIVKKYDAESNFRNLKGVTAKITVVLCVMLSLFHVYTAGFGLLNEVMHRTVHLCTGLGVSGVSPAAAHSHGHCLGIRDLFRPVLPVSGLAAH